jgi:ferredoxin--NADP+ reductase
MNLSEYDISHPYAATVKESRRITPDTYDVEVRHILLEVQETAFAYQVGQSIGVLTPGPHPFGNNVHFRIYSFASAAAEKQQQATQMAICVRRCFYIDEVSGERYRGISSNYLCDLRPGDGVSITGPYGRHFQVPRDNTSNLIMVGSGTGIAPFRAFAQHIFAHRGKWKGEVRLFYGASTGMELLYMNDVNNDLGNYYQQESFKAFEALSPSPYTGSAPAIDRTLEDNAKELWHLLQDPDTYVYLAGLTKTVTGFEKAMNKIAGSEHAWQRKKKELMFKDQWSELLYE